MGKDRDRQRGRVGVVTIIGTLLAGSTDGVDAGGPSKQQAGAQLEVAAVTVRNDLPRAVQASADDVCAVEQPREATPTMEFTLLNHGAQCAVVTRATIDIRAYAELRECQGVGDGNIVLAGHYTVPLPDRPRPGSAESRVNVELSHQVGPDETNRFALHFTAPDLPVDDDALRMQVQAPHSRPARPTRLVFPSATSTSSLVSHGFEECLVRESPRSPGSSWRPRGPPSHSGSPAPVAAAELISVAADQDSADAAELAVHAANKAGDTGLAQRATAMLANAAPEALTRLRACGEVPGVSYRAVEVYARPREVTCKTARTVALRANPYAGRPSWNGWACYDVGIAGQAAGIPFECRKGGGYVQTRVPR